METMQGMSLKSLRKHPALIPLYFFTGVGMIGALVYTARLAVYNPDVSWNRTKYPVSNEEYRNKQYKFYSISDSTKCPAPEY